MFPLTHLTREQIEVTVLRGRVTLSGTIGSSRERATAEATVWNADGVEAVANRTVVRTTVWTPARFLGLGSAYGLDGESGGVAGRIEALLERDNEVDGTTVRVSAQGGSVVPTEFVRSWCERDRIERLAWRAPGVIDLWQHPI